MGFIRNILGKYRTKILNESEEEIYRRHGVAIGKNTKFYNVEIDGCFKHLISVGNNCCLTHCTLLAHDASTHNALGYSKIGRIKIGDNVFIGYHAIVLPGVEIGNNCIIGAGGVVVNNVPSNSIVVGSPAKIVDSYDNFVKKYQNIFEKSEGRIFNSLPNDMTIDECLLQSKLLSDGKTGWSI